MEGKRVGRWAEICDLVRKWIFSPVSNYFHLFLTPFTCFCRERPRQIRTPDVKWFPQLFRGKKASQWKELGTWDQEFVNRVWPRRRETAFHSDLKKHLASTQIWASSTCHHLIGARPVSNLVRERGHPECHPKIVRQFLVPFRIGWNNVKQSLPSGPHTTLLPL